MIKIIATLAALATATSAVASASVMDPARAEQCGTHYLAMVIITGAAREKDTDPLPPSTLAFAERMMTTVGAKSFEEIPETVKTGASALVKEIVNGGEDKIKTFAENIMACDKELGLEAIRLK